MSRTLNYLRSRGFDESKHVPFSRNYRIKCSQCNATTINGVPVHEAGCPHETHECKGCNDRIPMNRKYCDDCN